MAARHVFAAAVLLATGIFTINAGAQEREVRTVGGAYLGKFKYARIDPRDALIELNTDGRNLTSVHAGLIGNNIYQEVWRFGDGYITYSQLPGFHFYQVEDLAEDRLPRLFCRDPGSIACEVLSTERISKKLMGVVIRNYSDNRVCGGAVYIDESGSDSDAAYLFGNYQFRSFYCLDPGKIDEKEALAMAFHYLTSLRKDGRRATYMQHYDLPKPTSLPDQQAAGPSTRTPAPPQQVEYSVRFHWEGGEESGNATLTTTSAGRSGPLVATMAPPLGRCAGQWEMKGRNSSGAKLPFGVWSLSCENEVTASGDYRMQSSSIGVGRGKDSNGRTVQFNFAN